MNNTTFFSRHFFHCDPIPNSREITSFFGFVFKAPEQTDSHSPSLVITLYICLCSSVTRPGTQVFTFNPAKPSFQFTSCIGFQPYSFNLINFIFLLLCENIKKPWVQVGHHGIHVHSRKACLLIGHCR